MIKRRFYKIDHGDGDAPSESSSSSPGSEIEAKSSEEDEQDQEQESNEEECDDDTEENNADNKNNTAAEMPKQNVAVSSSSGYESEDSSGNEVNLDSSGFLARDDDNGTKNYRESISRNNFFGRGVGESNNIQHKTVTEIEIPCEHAMYILKHKSVFKCRICPRIVCLSEETLNAHVKSKRHARSEKLLREGRLKLMLNDNGRIDGEEELSSRKKEKEVDATKGKKGLKRQRLGKRSQKGRRKQF